MAPGIIENMAESMPSSSNSSGIETPEGTGFAEPIAIVGMACRFPGDSDTPQEFWEMLMEKRSGYSEPPLSRFNINGWHATKSRQGSLRPRGGYFISEDTFKFDSPFFAITPQEAMVMDPQQRKLLEVVYEAFESGGVPLERVSGTKTGVYVGNFTWDYGVIALQDGEYPKPYSMTGHGVTILSNRISYVFNLCGPSLTLDTACSSSMYATHQACRALSNGEINGAVVGGTNMILSVAVHTGVDKMGVLSPTSTCHTFDSQADGYGRGEGVGALYLKRLSDAIRDKDPIRGIIRGTAVNANGKTSGITQPSSVGQEAVIRDAYNFAGGLDPDLTSFFECHGTGTAVGDPTELKAISNFFIENSKRESLLIGAVKTNVGHAEAASAMASIMKVALALETKTIPATIGIKKYNPKIDFKNGRLQVVRETTKWPSNFSVRRASVNSFGYGGANAHAIIESVDSMLPGYVSYKNKTTSKLLQNVVDGPAPAVVSSTGKTVPRARTQFILPFSAHDQPTLKANIANIKGVSDSYAIEDLGFTLTERRSRFFNRAYAIVDKSSVVDDLDEESVVFGKRGNGANIAFVFTGQGAQTAQMGIELMESFPSYLQTIRDLDSYLQALADPPSWSIEEELLRPKATSCIDQVHLSQPLCTAVQIAVVDLLRKWNITPVAAVGHSSGEIAATYASGLLTARQAIVFAYLRGVAVGNLTKQGLMLAVGLGADEVQQYLEPGIIVACHNSPESVTLSGDEDVANKVKRKLEEARVFVRAVKTNGRAYHSHHMQEVGTGYMEKSRKALFTIQKLEEKTLPQSALFVSSVIGVDEMEGFIPGPEYWKQNLESPVKFTQALETILTSTDVSVNHIIEIGPHSALAGPIRQIRDKLGKSSRDIEYSATLVRGENSVTRLLDLAGNLFIKGHSVNLTTANAVETIDAAGTLTRTTGSLLVDLPRYKWNYSAGDLRFENRLNSEFRRRKHPRHDLLGSKLPGSMKDQVQFRNVLDLKDLPWLGYHQLGPQPVFPGTGYLAIALEAARRFYDGKVDLRGSFRYFFPQVTIKAALNLAPAGTGTEIMTSIRFQTVSDSISSTNWLSFVIQSQINDVWTEHCVGTIGIKRGDVDLEPLFDESELQEPKTSHTWYRGFRSVGLNYGESFNGLSDIRVDPGRNDCTALTDIVPKEVPAGDSTYLVHPGTMDTCLQAYFIAAHNGSLNDMNHSFIPVNMEEISVWCRNGEEFPVAEPGQGRILATGVKSSLRALESSFQLFDSQGRPLIDAKKVRSIAYSERLGVNSAVDRHPYLRVQWKPDFSLLPEGPLPVAAINSTKPIIEKEQALLSLWANNLLTAARKHPSAREGTVAAKITEWFKSVGKTSPVPFDLSGSSLSDEFYELEGIYASLIKKLAESPIEEDTADKSTQTKSFSQILDLLCHKNPTSDILLLGDAGIDISTILNDTLSGKSSLKRYKSVTCISASEEYVEAAKEEYSDLRQVAFEKSDLSGSVGAIEGQTYDIIIIPEASKFDPETASLLKPYLAPEGRILIHSSGSNNSAVLLDAIVKFEVVLSQPTESTLMKSWLSKLSSHGIAVQTREIVPSGWTVVTKPTVELGTSSVIVLSREIGDKKAVVFSKVLQDAGFAISYAALSDTSFTATANATYISVVELGDSLFPTLTETQLNNMQFIAEVASSVFWITSGDLLGKADAHAATVMGLGRALQTEHVQLDFFTIDFDHSNTTKVATKLLELITRPSFISGTVDKELIVKDGLYHISRLAEDRVLDEAYKQKVSREGSESVYNPNRPVHIDIGKIGLLDTIHFKEDVRDNTLAPGQAEVEVKSVGLNMKEYATLRGSFNSESLSHEGSGVVKRVAAGVTNIRVGDRVCWMGKGMFGNIERFSANHLHKIRDSDSYEDMASIPLAFSTAVYGLLYLGRLKKGEKVLISSATGGVGLAAVQVAQMVGAEVFATVGTAEKREFLKAHFNLDDGHIFNSRDTSFAQDILQATNGYGIDVSLNSLVRELLKASWSIMANNGRHIEIGRTDILDYGSLDLNIFKKNTTFSAFDFGVVADEHPEIVEEVMTDVMKYYREGKISVIKPLFTYPASQIATAFEKFADGNRIGKIVVNFGSSKSDTLKVLRNEGEMTFNPNGSYLLIGSLGGLGRCMARWMVQKGARNLTFLGRSGADSKEAGALVKSLRKEGVTVNVIKGDVRVKADVQKCVDAAGVPIFGAVQAAMALEDKLFSKLDLPGWNYAVEPKIQGTLNLHECLAGQPLDFFVMISSISAMTGAPTQSNYCAGNTFLDFFARHRVQQGLPASTVGLSMVLEVGFVSQNEAMEQGIARSGIHGINESDFIHLMETAMLPQPKGDWLLDPNANKFLVSGLEPAKLAKDIDINGFRFWKQPRVGPLINAIEEGSGSHSGGKKGGNVLNLEGILEAVKEKFAKTFMVPVDDVDETKALVAFGMDSMIGTALRNWVFSSFSVDVPTADFMGPLLTAKSLADKIFSAISS